MPAALAAAVLLLQACGGEAGDQEDRPATNASACDLPLPEFAARTDPAEVESAAEMPLAVGVAGRDASATVVGYCQPSARFPEPAPRLVEEAGRVLHPIGGELQKAEGGWRNYYVYAPTESRRISVKQGKRQLAALGFEDEPINACALRASHDFKVLACGAIVLLEWSSSLPFDARRTTLVDVNALDGGDPAKQLNYYDLGYGDGPDGLRLRFGIRPPSSRRVELLLNYVYVRRGNGRIAEVALRGSESFSVRPGEIGSVTR